MQGRRVITLAATTALLMPGLVVLGAGTAQAACYSTKTSTSLVSANASVNYGSCRSGTTRSYARVGSAKGDSGWYAGSTSAWAKGIGSTEAQAQVSKIK